MDALLEQANNAYLENFKAETWFERAIFISWFCAKPTCKFCFMHTIKDKIKSPRKARRRLESILAEAMICRFCGWEIGFVSAGIASWQTKELKDILEGIFKITGKKQWLNLGVLKESQIEELLPFIEGITGTVECVNEDLREEIVPDKPLDRIEEMFRIADKYSLMKSITIIIGLGETIFDFPKLAGLIKKWKIDRINFYRLVPHEGAMGLPGPTTEYYTEWIAKTRIAFPKIIIVAGSWPDRTKEIPLLLKAGANAVTKLPAIKNFGKSPAFEIEEGARKAGRTFRGSLTRYPNIDIDGFLAELDFSEEIKVRIKSKYLLYHRKLSKYISDY